ncbi:hypothetical protein TIFTF001_048319 [Ficus carica]|uniref:Uncharacterized protein n=1 Tax=Ficus carica TaxID=3494 RepID=A0AA88CW63_FICCA|nr:hypothetical protein TIFTF001_048319 [Ficus carica]
MLSRRLGFRLRWLADQRLRWRARHDFGSGWVALGRGAATGVRRLPSCLSSRRGIVGALAVVGFCTRCRRRRRVRNGQS